MDLLLILAFNPIPVFIACLMQYSLITGNIPGNAASTKLTWVFGSLPNLVGDVENNLDSYNTCACTSRPITTSYFFPFLSIK